MTGMEFKVLAITRELDGDTFELVLDQGFGNRFEGTFRLSKADAPERHETGHDECTVFARQWMADRVHRLRVTTTKNRNGDDVRSFIRWVADVHAVEPYESLGDAITALMAEHGWTSEAIR